MGFWFFKSKTKLHEYFEIEKEEKNTALGLKIHICGDNSFKEKIISNLFSSKISDKHYSSRAKREFKTDQFYWISKIYKDLSQETLDEIQKDIADDRDKFVPNINQQVILCFISEKNKNLLSLFDGVDDGIYCPLFIIVSESIIDNFKNVDRRKITNIIVSKEMKIETLNSRIISALWENDCYYNEKGNKICRYTPDNIFNSLKINLSFYSINILLTGKSRAGKSTFINYLLNKLTALESCAKESVTQYLTEYYLYSEQKDKKEERTAIKIIDTPGISMNDVKKSKDFLENLLKNTEKSMEKQIHFILFFFLEGESLEGIDEIFELLNNCKIPVLFIINKAMDDSDNGKTKDINATISLLSRKKYQNLINKEDYIGINLVKTRRVRSFGVEDIFKRIYTIYNDNNSFKEDIKNKIKDSVCEYHAEVYDIIKEDEKNKYKIVCELKKELDKNINMFKYLNIDSIIKSGKKSAIKCKNVINSLNNISNKIDNFPYNNPIISFFQAFMVKEIGEIFGYDTKEMNYGVRLYLTEIHKRFENEEKEKIILGKKTEENDVKVVKLNKDIIEKQIKDQFERSNQELILNLANLFKEIKERYDKNGLDDDTVNRNLTNEICYSSMNFLEMQLKRTNGLIFFNHYLNICEKLLLDLKKYSQMSSDDWGKKEMKVIKE